MTEFDSDDPEALYRLASGLIDIEALNMEEDEWEGDAYRFLLKAAMLGHSDAQYHLGKFYYYEIGQRFTRDIIGTAVEWLKKSADQGNVRAMMMLSSIYRDGRYVQRSDVTARDYLLKAVESDPSDPDIQYDIGHEYHNGIIIKRNLAKAASWLRKAAEQGHADAQYELGDLLLQNTESMQGQRKAAKWLKRAAEQGHEMAQATLGLLYGYGIGVEQSHDEAAEWFRRAAEQGDPFGMIYLGAMYDQGILYDPNPYGKASEWYERAAEQGEGCILTMLAEMYDFGKIDVVDSYEKAIYWYTRAAALDDGKAIATLSHVKVLKDR